VVAIIPIYTILITVLFFGSSMIMMAEGMRQYQNYLVILIMVLTIVNLLIVKKKVTINMKNKATVFILLYFVSATVSAVLHNNHRMFLHPAQLLAIYLIVGLLLSSIFEEDYFKIIIMGILISHVPLIIISLIRQSIMVRPYSGVFYNPNSFGTVIATIFPIILLLIDEQIIKKHKNGPAKIKSLSRLIIYLFFGLVLLYLVLISGSRTSQGTVLILICVSILLLSRRLGVKSTVIKIIPSVSLFIIGTLMIPPVTNAILAVIEKNLTRLQHSAGITAGRFDFWQLTIEHATLFGNGHNFFGIVVPNNAHNTFFEILGIYGWIPLSFFIIWIIILLFESLKYTNKQGVRFSNLPLLMLIAFVFLSQGEVMTLKLSMFGMFASVGPVIQKKTRNRRADIRDM